MGTWQKSCFLAFALLVFGVAAWNDAPRGNAQPANPAEDQDREVLTRGPVHEAFGELVNFDPEPGIVVSQKPPEPIEELPPEQKPEGENVVWIGGYWGWEPDRQQFIWISGMYRAVPPDRQWIPGYWRQVADGYQWVSGYWAPVEQEVSYLPVPPPSLEVGPSSEAPSAEYAWAPGCWVWYETRYVWRPGYWYAPRPDWVYVPAHYVWTPGGCVFLEGYWDHVIQRRGLLFCPVAFRRVVFTRPGFVFTPRVVVKPQILLGHLFCWPRYRHYCFGDFYAASYLRTGIYPWFSFHSSRGHDPFFANHSWDQGRRDPRWLVRVREDFRFFRDNERARPPRTLAAQQALIASPAKRPDVKLDKVVLAQSLTQFARAPDAPVKLVKVEESVRKEVVQREKVLREVRTQRVRVESDAAAKVPEDPRKAKPVTVKMPPSSVVGKPAKELDKAAAPPPAPVRPKVDPDAKPTPPARARPKPEELLDPKKPLEKKPPPDVKKEPGGKKDLRKPPEKEKGPPKPPEKKDLPLPKEPPRPPEKEKAPPKPPEKKAPPKPPVKAAPKPPEKKGDVSRPPVKEKDAPKPPVKKELPRPPEKAKAPPPAPEKKVDRPKPPEKKDAPPKPPGKEPGESSG